MALALCILLLGEQCTVPCVKYHGKSIHTAIFLLWKCKEIYERYGKVRKYEGNVWKDGHLCKFNSSRFHMKKEGREREEGGLLGASSYIIKQTPENICKKIYSGTSDNGPSQ